MHKLIENQVRISVRNPVEFILRSGDIDNRHSTKAQYDAMQIGSRLHRKIQGSMPGTYKAEVSLKHGLYTTGMLRFYLKEELMALLHQMKNQ